MNKELTIASVLELARLTAWVMTDVVFLFQFSYKSTFYSLFWGLKTLRFQNRANKIGGTY